jgi:hypothetical protein
MKTITIILILIPILILNFPFLQAQTSPEDALQPLTVLLGEWEGSGFYMNQQQKRIEFRHKEHVTQALNQTLLLFNGKAVSPDGDAGFEAFGVVFTDPEDKQTYINAWTAEGQYTKAPITIEEGSFEWGFDVPNGGYIRYTATFSDTEWVEKGEYSPDKGTTWYPFLEMKLTR